MLNFLINLLLLASQNQRANPSAPSGTERRIRDFLRAYPLGTLRCVTAYADVFGLAWLEKHTEGRRVILLIGDARPRLFRGQKDDCELALRFLRRADTEVLNWYDKSQRGFIHQKNYVVETTDGRKPISALIGSANLTAAGLFRNYETMEEPVARALRRIWQQVRCIQSKGWTAATRIDDYISGTPPFVGCIPGECSILDECPAGYPSGDYCTLHDCPPGLCLLMDECPHGDCALVDVRVQSKVAHG